MDQGQGERLARLAADAAGAASPSAALRKVVELRRELDAFERRQVAEAVAAGASFASVARDLGLSRQAVHRRFRNVLGNDTALRVAADCRRILQYAREEAGARRLGSVHVVLGVLRADDVSAAGVLRQAGVTLDRARMEADDLVEHGRLFRREVDRADARALLAGAAREARARAAPRIEVEHLLISALADEDGGAARTLRALGADPVEVSDVLAASAS